MRIVAATRQPNPADNQAVVAAAASIAEAEEARIMRRDATAVVERMAVHARAAGLRHPVAAAIALGARVSELADPEAFADRHDVEPTELAAAEAGEVPFGALPAAYGTLVVALGLDLLGLADLEAFWARLDAETKRHG